MSLVHFSGDGTWPGWTDFKTTEESQTTTDKSEATKDESATSHRQLQTSHRPVKDDYRQITDNYRWAIDCYRQHGLQRHILSRCLLLKNSPYNDVWKKLCFLKEKRGFIWSDLQTPVFTIASNSWPFHLLFRFCKYTVSQC